MFALRLLLTASAFATAPVAVHAEVVDRIAIIVGRQVITTSQIDIEVRVTAFLSGQSKPAVTDTLQREAAARLIEQTLVRREIELTRFPTPKPEETGPLFEQAMRIHGDNFAAALREARLTEDDLKQHLLWQLTLLRFVQYRFQPGVSVTDNEIRDLYNQESAKLKAQGKPSPPFEESRKDLEALLTERHVDEALERWLIEQRGQTAIAFKVKELAP